MTKRIYVDDVALMYTNLYPDDIENEVSSIANKIGSFNTSEPIIVHLTQRPDAEEVLFTVAGNGASRCLYSPLMLPISCPSIEEFKRAIKCHFRAMTIDQTDDVSRGAATIVTQNISIRRVYFPGLASYNDILADVVDILTNPMIATKGLPNVVGVECGEEYVMLTEESQKLGPYKISVDSNGMNLIEDGSISQANHILSNRLRPMIESMRKKDLEL